MKFINPLHLFGALRYSLSGLRIAWKEQAFRHEVLLLPVMSALLLLLRPGFVWSLTLIVAWLLVMVVELLNSAIEEALDLITKDFNIHVKYGKDMASAAVFICVCINGLLWGCMLWQTLVG